MFLGIVCSPWGVQQLIADDFDWTVRCLSTVLEAAKSIRCQQVFHDFLRNRIVHGFGDLHDHLVKSTMLAPIVLHVFQRLFSELTPCGSLKRFLLQSTALLRLKDLLKVFGHRLQGLRLIGAIRFQCFLHLLRLPASFFDGSWQNHQAVSYNMSCTGTDVWDPVEGARELIADLRDVDGSDFRLLATEHHSLTDATGADTFRKQVAQSLAMFSIVP
mmetsp:Transcript_129135/g.306408  ORF Transcript_129135/g.306408 Transcript_129135/m.306408 type:complete len:216 (+) Transcript_129135:415-1062(+)